MKGRFNMNKNLQPKEILEMVGNAVKALGVTYETLVMMDVAEGDSGRITVYADGEYFGVYDTNRETFVD